MAQSRALRNDAALFCRAEDLLKVQSLPFVGDIKHLVGVIILLTLYQCGQIGCGIQRGSVGLDQNARRNLFGVARLLHVDDPRTAVFTRDAAGPEILEHGLDIGLRAAFAKPKLKVYVQPVVVAAHVCNGDVHDVLPQGPIAAVPVLQQIGGPVRPFGKLGIGFCTLRGTGIDGFELADIKGRLVGVVSGKAAVEIGQVRLLVVRLLDDQTHLQAPVAHVDITDGVVAKGTEDALDTLAYDGGAKMPNVQRLGDVRSAVVYNNGFGNGLLLQTEIRLGAHLLKICGKPLAGNDKVEKARSGGTDAVEIRIVGKHTGHILRNDHGCPSAELCTPQAAVALKFAQVRTVGNGNGSIDRVVAAGGKGGADLRADQVGKFFHILLLLL